MKRYALFLLLSLCIPSGLFAQAVATDFGYSYALLPKGNQTSVLLDGTIIFPDTTVNVTNPVQSQINSATFVITNRGTSQGIVNNITAGGAFKVAGVPLLPAVVRPGQTLTFTIDFQPAQLGLARASLHIDFLISTSVSTAAFDLIGNGVGSLLAFEFVVASNSRPVFDNDTLTLPQTNVGDKTTVTMFVRNIGTSDAIINFLASSDASFKLENAPFLPLTVQPGTRIGFNITFAPTQPGTYTARLKVGDATFNLSSVGLGVTLTYTVVVGSASTTVTANGNVIFTPTQVGASSSADFQISNTGNTATFINSVSVTGPAMGVFTLTNVSTLPVKINAGATVSFGIGFTPITLGQVSGTLKVDNQTFNLSGVGDTPPPLPGVSFAGATSAVDAAQQISVGVALDNPYPVQLSGKLTLTFAPTADVFSDDPAIAFASGGRTVNFVVPANSRNAVFGLSDNRIRLQTGTVAGTVTLTATFATDAGAINLTTTAAPATNMSVRPSVPRITSVQLSARTASAITVLITGYSPTRSINTMAFTFTPFVDPSNKDLKLDTTSLSLSVDGPFGVWYRSTGSQTFGSLFTATVTFNVFGNVEAIQSLGVTISNSLGISNAGSVTLR